MNYNPSPPFSLHCSPLPNLGPTWEADVIEALNNTSLHTVASWAGPHSISTPVTKRREERGTHKVGCGFMGCST